jgi:hypothetical protein
MHSPASVSVHSASGEGDGSDERSGRPPPSTGAGAESEPQAATLIEKKKIAETRNLKRIGEVYPFSVKVMEFRKRRM